MGSKYEVGCEGLVSMKYEVWRFIRRLSEYEVRSMKKYVTSYFTLFLKKNVKYEVWSMKFKKNKNKNQLYKIKQS